MNSENTVPVAYIGNKEMKTDTVGGTGVVWFGKGDVQPYPSNLLSKLLFHKEVWARADGEPSIGSANQMAIRDPLAGEDLPKGPGDSNNPHIAPAAPVVNQPVEAPKLPEPPEGGVKFPAVPGELDQELMDANPVDSSEPAVPASQSSVESIDAGDRQAKIKETLELLELKDLNGAGYPIIKVVRDTSGLQDLESKEVNVVWKQLQEAKSA